MIFAVEETWHLRIPGMQLNEPFAPYMFWYALVLTGPITFVRVLRNDGFAILVNLCTQQQCSCDKCALIKCRGGSGVDTNNAWYEICHRRTCVLRRTGEERVEGVQA